MATLAFAAALAVHDAVSGAFDARSRPELALKWPNDVLCNGAKVSGILLESHTLADRSVAAVIGCGINCNSHPELAGRRTTSIRALGGDTSPAATFDRLSAALENWLGQWDRGGFAAIRDAWLDRAAGLGEPVEARLPGETIKGNMETLATDGALVLRLGNGVRRRVTAGDVFLSGEIDPTMIEGAA